MSQTLDIGKWTPELLENLVMFDHEECERIVGSLHELKDHWVKRMDHFPFYTLGASNYLDKSHHENPPYHDMRAVSDPILRDQIGWAFTRICEVLQETLEAPVTLAEEKAVPGFQIFLADDRLKKPTYYLDRTWFGTQSENTDKIPAHIHCDTAQNTFRWPEYEAADLERPISITIPVQLPNGGGGMHVWDCMFDDTRHLDHAALRQRIIGSQSWFHQYERGQACLHSGLRYHAIAGMRDDPHEGDARITIQGHGIFADGSWRLFW